MRGVTIDPATRTARAEAGALWIEVVEAARRHGLAALAGSSPDVVVPAIFLGDEAEGVKPIEPLRALGPVMDTVATIPVEAVGPGSGSGLLTVELRHLGGAIRRPAPDHGAIAAFDAEFVLFAAGIAPTPELEAKAHADVERLLVAMQPWGAEQTYMNFVERREDARRFVSESAYHRLRRIKAAFDPHDVIRSNHPLDGRP